MNKKKILQIILAASTVVAGVSLKEKVVQAQPIDNTSNNIEILKNTRSIQKGKVVNVETNLRVREDASTNSEVLGYLNNNEEVNIEAETGNWYRISFNGRDGYVSKDYIKIESVVENSKLNQKGQVVNITSSLRIRQAASTSSAIIGTLHNGDTFEILSKSGNWYNIKSGNTIGFISGDYVKVLQSNSSSNSSSSNTSTKSTGKIINVTSNLRIRTSPNTSSSILGYLLNGDNVNILGESGSWYNIDYNGKSGYVHKDYVQKNNNSGSSSGNSSNNDNTTVETSKGHVVNAPSSLRVRSSASTSSSILGYLKDGQTVTIKGSTGNWYKINFNGTTGYVSKDYIANGESTGTGSPNNSGTNETVNKIGIVYNVTSNLRVRSEASTSSSVLGYLLNGEKVTITGNTGGWYKILFNNKPGYVSQEYIKITGNSSEGSTSSVYESVLSAMKGQLGSPYVWGGSGEKLTTSLLNELKRRYPSQTADGAYIRAERYVDKGYRAFDCSGLMQWGFRQAGISIGRSTWDQINNGVEVSVKNAKPGDLLFYSNLQHVGMYLGNNQWIEAPNKNSDVRIVNVPWSKIGRARRVLN